MVERWVLKQGTVSESSGAFALSKRARSLHGEDHETGWSVWFGVRVVIHSGVILVERSGCQSFSYHVSHFYCVHIVLVFGGEI